MSYEVKIIADSLAPCGKRLTTLTATYPRFVHCFDNKTEVLCEIGGRRQFRTWVHVDAAFLARENVLIAAYHEGGDITFERPSSVVAYAHEGEMIQSENQRLSFCVTPDHRMYVGSRKKGRDQWEIVFAKDLHNCTQKRFRTCGMVADGKIDLGQESAELVGFFVGDGTLPRNGKQAIFHLKKARKIDYVCRLLDRLGIQHDVRPFEDGTTNVVFDRIPILEECYDSNRKKRIPDAITTATPETIEGFLFGLWFSDGSTDRKPLTVFNTTSDSVASDLGALAAMSGRRINFTSPYERNTYKLQSQKEIEPILRKDKNPVETVMYSGMVYCASVSTGLLIVRRGGIVHVSGNSEVMTHRDRARNAASSRAIPWSKMRQVIIDDPVIPLVFGSEQRGMQTGGEVESPETSKTIWLGARDKVLAFADLLHEQGVHKSLVNRIVEPWMWITVVMSATEWANFFRLRCHPDAEIHFQKIAGMIRDAIEASTPVQMDRGSWHLPYCNVSDAKECSDRYADSGYMTAEEALRRISVARCARVSYLTHEGKRDIAKDLELFDRLVQGSGFGHWSAHEHVAMATNDAGFRSGPFVGWHQYRKDFALENAAG